VRHRVLHDMTDKTFLVICVGPAEPAYSCLTAPIMLTRMVRGAADEEAAAIAVKTEVQQEYPGRAFRDFEVIQTTRITLDGGPLGARLVADKPRPDDPTG
jgi:hypothetical protein